MYDKINVNIVVDDAINVSSDLSDLLCWWEGFKIGLKLGDTEHFIVAENGIDAARNINILLKEAIINHQTKIKNQLFI